MTQHNALPAPNDDAAREKVRAAVERWKKTIYPLLPGEPMTVEECTELTRVIVAWCDQYAPSLNLEPLEEVARILRRRRASGESIPEGELVTAAERAARVCDRIMDWLVSAGGSAAGPAQTRPISGIGRGKTTETPLRSYTQADLDVAIREYQARRAPRYQDLVEAVKSGSRGARKAAQAMFGRNAIARALGVKAKAMVSKSEPWLQMARELQLPHKKAQPAAPAKQKKIGMAIAEERKAEAQGDTVSGEVIHNETMALARRALPTDLAESVIQQLLAGEIDDDRTREIIELSQEQGKDDKSRKLHTSI
jgi:hypothetical protein